MPTDLTGTPTSLGIGTYNVDADAPSGLGFNEAMAQIDALIASRLATPAGILSGEIPVWNGSTWVRSSALGMSPSGVSGYPNDVTKFLHGDGSWQSNEIGYDEITASVFPTATSSVTANTVIAGSAYTFDGKPVIMEFHADNVGVPTGTVGLSIAVGLFEGATLINFANMETPATGSQFTAPFNFKLRFTPTAASHTYSIKAWVTSGTGAVFAGTRAGGGNGPAYLRFTRASS